MAPFRQRTVFEVNADLSFYQLNDDIPMRWSKYSEKGTAERRALVETKLPGSLRIVDAEVPGTSQSHLLDAAAILWTARRIFAKAAIRIPTDPEWDEQGLRMEFLR
jgi:predicted RNase H-like nuclease